MANVWETVFRYYGIDWIALALNATAIYLLGKKRKSGFTFGVVANVAWIVFAVLAHSLATVVACTIFVILNVKGWRSWSQEQSPGEPGKAA